MLSQAEIRENVTNRIVAALKSGAVPFWRQTWAKSENSGPPTNAVSRKPYRGINWALLTLAGHNSKWWATYNQWRSLGGQVRRGEKATQIMLKVHREGIGVCGVFPRDVAQTRVEQVAAYSRQHQHPLQCVMEEN